MIRSFKKKRLTITTIVYWFLLCYIVAALAWWYLELYKLNEQYFAARQALLSASDSRYGDQLAKLTDERDRKRGQFAGEGITFFVVTIIAAIFVYRSVKKQIAVNTQQQNFMMAVTHELKTPIAVTKLNLETLKRHKLDSAHVDRIISNSLQETNRLNDLCNNILISSQLETGSFQLNREEIQIDRLLNDIADELARRFPKRVLDKKIKNNISVAGDELMLRMAMNNLIENAFKYSGAELPVLLTLEDHNSDCYITITDYGPGIPEAEKKKIFEKFYRIGDENTRNTKGTGLGLYLTKKIIRDHGGKISIRDNQPSGAIFIIELPKS